MKGNSKPLLSPRLRSCSDNGDCGADIADVVSTDGVPAHVGSASIPVALTNLVLAVLGAGQLVLPYAFRQLGLGFGLLALMFFIMLSVHSLHTLSVYELHFTPGHKCIDSYAELVVRVLGKAGSTLCSVLLALYAWGGAVSFMVILKAELAFIYQLVSPSATDAVGSYLLGLLAFAILWPLSSVEDLSALKKCSPLGCVAALFITVVVLISTRWSIDAGALFAESCAGPTSSTASGDEGLKWWPTSFLDVAASLPLLSFALNSSWAYIPILCTLRTKSASRVTGLICGSNSVIMINYVLIAAYGYNMFCSHTQANILESFGNTSGVEHVLLSAARIALTVQLTLALPMRFFVTRRTIGGDLPGTASRSALAAFLVASATALAVTPLSLATAMGVTSSICASMIIYILPAVVDLKIQLPGPFRKMMSVVSLCVGIFILAAGTAANLLGVAVGGG
eukprot:TRINITY_DN23635_c0_g1_i1.p1 TRINITY_DN23635_c0_g1~~TRINITY_DN23635_c0_g1_i1.p1  ORF type:complete len:453 (-),score=40.86 TRINITY_DN23635_c0_g1_i1:282-1640(-)